jgi:hypothetical protein
MSATVDQDAQAGGTYTVENLLPVLRLFIRARNEAKSLNFPDNGGAIHSVERILDILCQRISYPHLRHINNLKKDPKAVHSVAAHKARERGEPVEIEHVKPHRAYACKIIDLVGKGKSDKDLIEYIKRTYRLVLLTKAERRALDKQNRSQINAKRLDDIEFCKLCTKLQVLSGRRSGQPQ